MDANIAIAPPAPTGIGYPSILQRLLPRAETDPRAAFATRDPLRFLALAAQLALAVYAIVAFRLEEPAFVVMMVVVSLGFAVHYWLPFSLKEPFLIALSLGSAFLLLQPVVAGLVLLTGFALYAIVASPAPFGIRVSLVLLLAGALMWFRANGAASLGVPDAFWPVVGAIFMFRLIIYLYDMRHAKEAPKLNEFLTYFFIIPNYYFLLFPVVDFRTMLKSYFQRDIHHTAQVGMGWIARGLVQLVLYRLVYHYKLIWSPETITSFPMLIRNMVLIYLLYLRVSGTFHIIIGILHLFGYNLPETHRSYLLSSSLTDFWRRINIYWKDFMVKVVYFPVYFRIRRLGEVRAQVIATVAVFVATWFLHSYQFFWLSGTFLISGPDIAFWSILGALVVGNLLLERRQARRRSASTLGIRIGKGVQTATTLAFITVLWSMWNSPSIEEWLDIMTWWRLDA